MKSLAYFRDAEEDEMPKMLAPIAWDDVKKFLESEARTFALTATNK